MKSSVKKVSITTGDIDGVGLEVAVKALLHLGPQPNTVFFLNRSALAPKKVLQSLDKKFDRVLCPSIEEGLSFLSEPRVFLRRTLIDIVSEDSPPFWVQKSAELCQKKILDGLVTGPMSKTLIVDSGFKDLGHTDILARVSNSKNLHMGFIGRHFNVVLATGHIPHQQVSQKLTINNLKDTILQTHSFTKALGLGARPIGFLGLNPHSGERGLIGKEEISVINKAISWAKNRGIKIAGPLVPDAAFFRANWPQYSSYIACYHDQGLIPFKMVHGQDDGCHVTLGLPFVRTSVDHGTAKDIFGQNKANPNSMISAIKFCIKLMR